MDLAIVLTSLAVFLLVVFLLFIRSERFGRLPVGEQLGRIKASGQYRNGSFQNISPTPDLTEGATFWSITKEFVFNNSKRSTPPRPIAAIKNNLLSLPSGEDVIVWFGHSSYLLQLDGKKFLVDPVFMGNASPLRFTTRSFKGTDLYSADDLPQIDYLIITHDHWDHLDYRAVKQLKDKVRLVVTGLGTGAHLEKWGYPASKIREMDWHERLLLETNISIDSVPARHFSGRGFKRNQVLWMSFVITTSQRRLLIGGDSGYDTHFKDIGAQFGPFDLAILECGQYNKSWKFIHLMPEEVIQAAFDLKAKSVLPVHWGKFVLALHDWDEPIRRVVKEGEKQGMPVIHPMIGEIVKLGTIQTFDRWWEKYQ